MHGSRGGPCKPVQESKWMGEMFQKKGKRFGNLAKNVQNLKIIKKKPWWLQAIIAHNELLE